MTLTQMRWAAMALILISAGTALSPAQSVLTGVAHVAIRVSDVGSEVRFLGKLGLQEAFAHEENGERAFVFVKVNDREFIEVHPHTPLGATAPQPLGFTHICYETPSANALHAKWAAARMKPTDVAKGPDGTLEFAVTDPAGGVTEALQFLPDSQPAQDNGRHLSPNGVSSWLMGIDMQVSDLHAWQTFYQQLGFTGAARGTTALMNSVGNPELQIRLHKSSTNAKTSLMFRVNSLEKAAMQLRNAGLTAEVMGDHLVTHDPDGNSFVLIQEARSQP